MGGTNYYFNTSQSIFLSADSAQDMVAINLLPPLPSYPSGFVEEVRLNSVQYGNGYKQDSPDGINFDIQTLQLSFANRRARVIQELLAFFRGQGDYSGRDPSDFFYFQLPSVYNDDTVYQYKCMKWNTKWASVDIGTLEATFTQTFEF